MSIATQITRIQQDRNTIRTKLVSLGLATNTDNLDVLAEAVDGIVNCGSITATVREGETYTIPKGYHNGSGTVSGVAGGGNYSLQTKGSVGNGIVPTKKEQSITPDEGFYGLADVIIAPIPDTYQDVTSVTAGAADVLTGKTIVSSNGTVTAGTMKNNGAVSKTLTTADASYTVPGGYHSGAGKVQIVPEDKSVTPTKASQEITAASGKVLNKVTVAAIPDAYQVVTGVTAGAGDVLGGKNIVDAEGNLVVGTMANNGAFTKTLDASAGNQSATIAAGYHNGSGKVTIVLEEKSATPTKASQSITPAAGKVLSKVTVNPIPAAYQDVTGVTATADKVLTGSDFVDSQGKVVPGTMADNGADAATTLSVNKTSTTIAKGYHDGTAVVNIVTETKSATPTKASQTISATAGKVLSSVTVAAIPAAYQDVTEVTTTADKVLEGSSFVDSEGNVVEGTMADTTGTFGSVILDTTETLVDIPQGYHTGECNVSIALEEKSVTPTKSAQNVTPSARKVLSKVTVAAIPDAYQDVTGVTAEAAHVLAGKKIVAADGEVVTGTMANNGAMNKTIDGLTATSVTIPAGYTTGGTVSLTSDIEDALAAI